MVNFVNFDVEFIEEDYRLTIGEEVITLTPPTDINQVLNELNLKELELVVPTSLNFMSNLYSNPNNPHVITENDHVAKIILLYLIHFHEKADILFTDSPTYLKTLLEATEGLSSEKQSKIDELADQSLNNNINNLKNNDVKDDIKKTNDMLTTLLSKIDNKEQIYGSLRYFSWLWLILLFICVLVLAGINVNTSEIFNLKFPLMLGVSLSICVLVIINMMFFKKNTYEHFTTTCTDEDNDFIECKYYASSSNGSSSYMITHKVKNHVRDILFEYDLLVNNLNNSLKDDTSKIMTNILQDVKNKKYIYVRQYQSLDYKTNEIKLQIKYMKYGLLMTGVIGTLFAFETKGYINTSLAYFITLISLLLYCLVILLIIKNNKYRNKYNWNKIYWNIGDIKEVCRGPESDNCVLK